ncbi:MAG: ribosomal-processing cysteine protease Prp [Spirochaetales bacterium]|nr:ribosomal-processing cysteine protease Prp [Spirochaetales bacterium]
MIAVAVGLDSHECISELNVTGHAGLDIKGNDPLCAAVSILTRTLLTALYATGVADIKDEHEQEGMLAAEITIQDSADFSRIAGITAFFLTGLFELQNDYPQTIMIDLFTKNSEETDGT